MSILFDHVDRMLALIQEIIRTLASGKAQPEQALDAITAQMQSGFMQAHEAGAILPDQRIAQHHDLSPMEMATLWLATAPHLDPEAFDWIARANDNILRDQVDVSLCLRCFSPTRKAQARMMAKLSPTGTLVRHGLVSLIPSEDRHRHNRMFHQVKPQEQLPGFLAGRRDMSAQLAGYTESIFPSLTTERVQLAPSSLELSRLLASFYARPHRAIHDRTTQDHLGPRGMGHPLGALFILEGGRGSGRTTTIKAIAGSLNRRVILVEGEMLAQEQPSALMSALKALIFEANLYEELVCIRDAGRLFNEESPPAAAVALVHALQQSPVACVLCVDRSRALAQQLDPLTLWKRQLDDTASGQSPQQLWALNVNTALTQTNDADFDHLNRRINLRPVQVRKALRYGYLLSDNLDNGGPTPRVTLSTPLLEGAAMAQIPRTIGALATVSEPKLSFSDLIVDDETDAQVQQIVSAVHNRRKVLVEWGLGERISRGTGITVLFDGEPGTGKTHCAEVIASELGLSLVRINIPAIVDKYIGETEKNLTRIFEQARPDVSVLLFDEADSLFSKRTQKVERSTDRYSNMNVNVLLQLIERYEGTTVLTTNLKQAIDPAFERRITFKLHFKLPERDERARIWRYLLPASIKVDGAIDFEWLSDITMSGGEIKNAILLAAYQAASEGVLLGSEILYDAAQREVAASGRIIRHDHG